MSNELRHTLTERIGLRSVDHCLEVQERRYKAKKKGVAKAVRRFIKYHYHPHSGAIQDDFGKMQVNWAGCRPQVESRLDTKFVPAEYRLSDRQLKKSNDKYYKLFGI